MRKVIANVLELIGLAAVTTALWMFHVYVGLGFAGLVAVAAGYVLDRRSS